MINAGCWRVDCDVLIHDGMKDKCSNRMLTFLEHNCLFIYVFIVVLARMKIVQPSPAQQQPQNWN